ncbi:unnamed protein product [Didymodactylos carnosus]|uniref:EGF-like domain-containing protein n=1 Tax=Didymodactylos carnosus TaxID=1234261 RepID=A0A814TFC9_9BILA|nr:unnamed protein product [Didymodactylos carnosus]CAF1158824.1 unnamed protein product [Didymodactylos carnosus]CAF3811887.1 unnamed protein product [Didymodactylos carnosus]CAF3922231.1 unnamed protein product [Didymodactylos carnosus]
MTEQGCDIENEAKVEFYVSVDATQQSSYDKITHDKFTAEVQEKHTSTLGGDTSITTIENWSATVPSNPVIIKLGIRSIFDLLNHGRFPNDSLIQNKSALIAQALNNYIVNPVYCYNNCTDHGSCVPSAYFQFGICNCSEGFSGFDCSVKRLITATKQNSGKPANSGTMCAFFDVQFAILQLFILMLFSFSFMC